jgi:hypothetical protein
MSYKALKIQRTSIQDIPAFGKDLSEEHLQLVGGGDSVCDVDVSCGRTMDCWQTCNDDCIRVCD